MQNKIFLRILLSFLIVSSFYTLIITVSVVRETYSQQRSDTVNQIQSNMQQSANLMDEQLATVNDTIFSLTSRPSVRQLAVSKTTPYHLYTDVHNDILNNSGFQTYNSTYTVGISQRYNSKVVSSAGYFQFGTYLNYLQLAGMKKQIRQFFRRPPDNGNRLIQTNDRVLLLRAVKVEDAQTPIFFLITWRKKELSPLTIYNNKGQLLLLDTLNKATKSQLPFSRRATTQFQLHNNTEVLTRKQGNNQFFIRESRVIPSILFTYKINNHSLSRLPAHLVRTLVLYFTLLLVVGGLLVIGLSRNSFRPYAKIIDEVQQIDSNVQPQNVELLLAKIHDLVAVNHRYEQFQEDVTNNLELLFLKNLMLNSYSKKDIGRFKQILSLENLQNGGLIAIITFSKIATIEEPLGVNERKDARKKAIRSAWPTPLKLLFDIDVNHYAIIQGNLNNEAATLPQTIQAVTDTLTKKLHIPITALISSQFNNLSQIPSRFADVYSVSTVAPESRPISASNIMITPGSYTVEAEAEIITTVGRRDFSKAGKLLDAALAKLLTQDSPTIIATMNVKYTMLNTLKRILDNAGLSVSEFIDHNHDLISRLDLEPTPAKVHELIVQLYHVAFKLIENTTAHHRTVEEHITDYINRNYTHDLALSEIADHYHMSESHTSRLIKEHLGISFKDYLFQIRMRQAKNLLLNTDRKITDITAQVGYKNVNTFIRAFKNITGQTPGQFRRGN